MPITLSVLDIKSTRMDALAVQLKTSNIADIELALVTRFNKILDAGTVPLVLDIQALESPEELDLKVLLAIFKHHGLNLVGIRHSKINLASWAMAYGLVFSPVPSKKSEATINAQAISIEKIDEASSKGAVFASEVGIEKKESNTKTNRIPKTLESEKQSTVLITQPVRTGQQVYAKNADLILLAVVNQGAEVIADGNIHVYAPLRGRALAGAGGDKAARIFTQCMQAELVSIAGVYRTIEQGLPPDIASKPAQVSLEQNRLVICALGAK